MMCGKIRAKRSWAATVDVAEARVAEAGGETIALRVMADLPLIVFDGGERMVVPMRWGFPDPKDWRRPRPIHARAETIDTTPAFAAAFRDGQRGIVLAESFNEAPDSGDQHIVTPAGPIGLAFVWRRFDIGGAALFACVMATVSANRLLCGLPTDRMPAVIAPEDWAVWLGEEPASPDAVKACLRTVEDVRWTMTREETGRQRAPRPPRRLRSRRVVLDGGVRSRYVPEMPEQLTLPGLAAAPTDRLFFAVLPDVSAMAQAVAVTDTLTGAHGLSGRRLAPRRLHVTLHHAGDFAGLPNDIVARALAAGEALRHAPVEVRFDKAGSFVRRHRTLPLVLRGGGQVIPLIAFQHALGEAMARQGFRHVAGSHYTPHMTLLYDPRYVEAREVTPVEWTARDFVLIRSFIGKARYEVLGRWGLEAE